MSAIAAWLCAIAKIVYQRRPHPPQYPPSAGPKPGSLGGGVVQIDHVWGDSFESRMQQKRPIIIEIEAVQMDYISIFK